MSLIGVPPSSSSRLTIQLTPFATDEAVPVNPGNGRTPQYGSRISTCDLRLSGRLGGLSGLPDMGQPPRDHVLVRTIGSEAAAEARIGAGLAKRKRDELLELLRPGFGRIEAFLQVRKYTIALMSDLPERNGWSIARFAGDRTPDKTQRLLNHASWDASEAMGVVRRFGADGLEAAARKRGKRKGRLKILALDETGQEKKGEHTAGVKRQHMGCAGGVENGINTVHAHPMCWRFTPAVCSPFFSCPVSSSARIFSRPFRLPRFRAAASSPSAPNLRTTPIASDASQDAWLRSLCVLSGVLSPANLAMLHPLRSGRSLISAIVYFLTCKNASIRPKPGRSSSSSSSRFRFASPAPILASAAASEPIVLTST